MPADPPIVCTVLRRVDKGALKGFITLRIRRWRLTLYSCRWFEQDGREWVDLRQCRWVASGGNTQYREAVQFDDRATADRFSAAALAAIRRLIENRGSRSSSRDEAVKDRSSQVARPDRCRLSARRSDQVLVWRHVAGASRADPLMDEIQRFVWQTRRLRDVPGYPKGAAPFIDTLAFIARHSDDPTERARARALRSRLRRRAPS